MANGRTPSIAFVEPDRSPGAFTHVQPVPKFGLDDPLAIAPAGWPKSRATTSPAKKVATSEAQRNNVFAGHALFDWYEHMHVVPRSFDFPNLLSDQSVPMVAYSAFRRARHTWVDLVNNAGQGVDFAGDPTLPAFMYAQDGYSFTLEVSTVGDPFVDATLDFEFTVGTIFVPITIRRIVLFDTVPEVEWSEDFEFLTDVIVAESGKEKRQKLRKAPRLTYVFDYQIDDDDRPRVENALFDFQSRAFGVPVWRDDMELTAAASAGATSLTVNATSFRDLRVGGLVVIFGAAGVFDVIEVTAFGATTITLDTPLLNSYASGSLVYPLQPSYARPTLQGGRYIFGMSELAIEWTPLDNDTSIGSTAGFSSFNGKVLFDGGNVSLQRIVRETFEKEQIRLDGEVGLVDIESPWDRHKHGFRLTIRASGRQATWQLRQVVYALAGQRTSFYVARDFDDLHVVADLLNGSNAMSVRNDGYAQFVRHRSPRNVLRVELTDGTKYLRTITNSVVSSPTVELLTLDSTWPSTIPVASVRRVDFVEKMRFATDRLRLTYDIGRAVSRLSAPVVAVFE